jgi:putative tricarboxylic transport membrane protein
MEKPPKWSPAVLFDLCLPAGGVIIILISLNYGFGTWRKPGPGLYPFFLGFSLAFFGLLLILSGLRSHIPILPLQRGDLRIFFSMIAAFCLWILLMPLLGYVAVTLFATFGFCKVMKLEGWLKPLFLSFGTTLFIYLLFDYWLYIDLPKGILG